MDPLSVSLAVVTLATAVKDIVELGGKIHDSFAKVSKNLRSAQRVARNIKEMVEEIEGFCEEHRDELANMKDFDAALRGLLLKFQEFETSILPLLPKIGQSKFGLFVRGWWNNNKIKERILDLESDVLKVMRVYMWKSAIRTEVKQEMNHQETTRGLSDIHNNVMQVLAVVQRNGPAIPAVTLPHISHRSSEATSNDLNDHIIMFAQSTTSTSLPMLHRPNVITEELITAAYIKLQINQIAILVEKVSTIPISALSSPAALLPLSFSLPLPSHSLHLFLADNTTLFLQDNIINFAFTTILQMSSMNIMHLRHHVVREITHIRDLLEVEELQPISFNQGMSTLYSLSVALSYLGMDHEAAQVGNWTTILARNLVGLHNRLGGPNLGAAFAARLLDQSLYYGYSASIEKSLLNSPYTNNDL